MREAQVDDILRGQNVRNCNYVYVFARARSSVGAIMLTVAGAFLRYRPQACRCSSQGFVHASHTYAATTLRCNDMQEIRGLGCRPRAPLLDLASAGAFGAHESNIERDVMRRAFHDAAAY